MNRKSSIYAPLTNHYKHIWIEIMKTADLLKKGINRIWYRPIELISYLINSIKPIPPDQVRLVIFGQGRTGSTLLESLLSSTGYFSKNGELLNTDRGEVLYPIQYVRGLSKIRASDNFVFHLKIYHLTRDRKRPIDPADFLNGLSKDGWKIIYLRRINKVKHALSNLIAEDRGVYHKFNNDKNKVNLSVDCDKFIEIVKERLLFEDAERKALANIEYHEIIYEEDLEKADSHQLTINRILDYISLDHRAATTSLRKINTQSMKDLIINYDEFVECLIMHGWQRFLDK